MDKVTEPQTVVLIRKPITEIEHGLPYPVVRCVDIPRGLIQSDARDLTHYLRELPDKVKQIFLRWDDMLRKAQEGKITISKEVQEGQLEEGFYAECTTLLEGLPIKMETIINLRIWASLPLVHSRQCLQDASTAFMLRFLMLNNYLILENKDVQVLQFFQSFWWTALYELACSPEFNAKDFVKNMTSSLKPINLDVDNTNPQQLAYFEVLDEFCRSDDPKAKNVVLKLYGKLESGYHDKMEIKPSLCLLLYFDYYYSGKWDISLLWLQKAKRLWQNAFPGRVEHPEHDLLFYEAELLVKLERFEEAQDVLNRWKITEGLNFREKNAMIETKVRQWQQKCYSWMKGKAKAEGEGDFRSAHESALEIPKSSSLDSADCNEQAGEWRQLPCPIIFEGGYPGNVRKLGQSQNGLLDYLPRLPQEVRVAFQRHIDRARAALDNADWEKAILEFQGCRDILKFSKKVVEKEVFDCLLVWVDLPLVKLYQCRKKSFFVASEIWEEMEKALICIRKFVAGIDEIRIPFSKSVAEFILIQSEVQFHLLKALFEYACKIGDCKLKGDAIENFRKQKKLVHEKEAEAGLCVLLFYDYMFDKSHEDALRWIQEAWRLSEHCPNIEKREPLCKLYPLIKAKLNRLLGSVNVAVDIYKEYLDSNAAKIRWSDPECSKQVLYTAAVHTNLAECYEDLHVWAAGRGYCSAAEQYEQSARDEVESTMEILTEACDRMGFDPGTKVDLKTELLLNESYADALDLERKMKYAEAIDHLERCISKMENSWGQRIHELRFNKLLGRIYLTIWQKWSSKMIVSEHLMPLLNEDFRRAVEYYEKCLELDVDDIYGPADTCTSLATLYSMVDEADFAITCKENSYGAFFRFDEAQHGSQLAQHGPPHGEHLAGLFSGGDSVRQNSDLDSYMLNASKVIDYAKKAVLLYADNLYNMTENVHVESWIRSLHNNKVAYLILEKHYGRKFCYLQTFYNQNSVDEESGKDNRASEQYFRILHVCVEQAFLWAERQRGRVLMYRLGLNNGSHISRSLWEFDNEDDLAMKSLQDDCAAHTKDMVFVEYSCNELFEDMIEMVIYVLDQNCRVTAFRWQVVSKKVFEEKLKRLLAYLNLKVGAPQDRKAGAHDYDDEAMHKDLEYFYSLLIEPISTILAKMDPQDKLVLAPDEVLANVPFAALRASKSYLIQKHTISLAPSLRILVKCGERYEALRKFPLSSGPGAIIAIGDPVYGTSRGLPRLKSTRKEVESIVSLFGKNEVVQLLGIDATTDKLVHWGKQPVDEDCRQAVFHIGAHGLAKGKGHSRGALFLACSDAKPYPLDVDRIDDFYPSCRRESPFGDEDENDTNNSQGTSLCGDRPKAPCDYANEDENCPKLGGAEFMDYDLEELYRGRNNDTFEQRKDGGINSEHISTCQFEWRAEMVILSACETLGGESTTEGLLNLARAFTVAGIPCTVASQWRVKDTSTLVLMEGFYTSLKRGMDVASALCKSMRDMLGNKDITYKVNEWAPFVVWGLPTVQLPERLREI